MNPWTFLNWVLVIAITIVITFPVWGLAIWLIYLHLTPAGWREKAEMKEFDQQRKRIDASLQRAEQKPQIGTPARLSDEQLRRLDERSKGNM